MRTAFLIICGILVSMDIIFILRKCLYRDINSLSFRYIAEAVFALGTAILTLLLGESLSITAMICIMLLIHTISKVAIVGVCYQGVIQEKLSYMLIISKLFSVIEAVGILSYQVGYCFIPHLKPLNIFGISSGVHGVYVIVLLVIYKLKGNFVKNEIYKYNMILIAISTVYVGILITMIDFHLRIDELVYFGIVLQIICLHKFGKNIDMTSRMKLQVAVTACTKYISDGIYDGNGNLRVTENDKALIMDWINHREIRKSAYNALLRKLKKSKLYRDKDHKEKYIKELKRVLEDNFMRRPFDYMYIPSMLVRLITYFRDTRTMYNQHNLRKKTIELINIFKM